MSLNPSANIFVPKCLKNVKKNSQKKIKNIKKKCDEKIQKIKNDTNIIFLDTDMSSNSLTGTVKYFIIFLISFFGFSEEEKSNFMSRWSLFMRLFMVLLNDFRSPVLHKKYRNFTNVSDVAIVVHENTEKFKKFENHIKTNKKSNKLLKKKRKNKKKSRKQHIRRLKNEYTALQTERRIAYNVRGDIVKSVPAYITLCEKIDDVLRTIESLSLKRVERRKAGLDSAYLRRLAKRREARGESPLELKLNKLDVPRVVIPVKGVSTVSSSEASTPSADSDTGFGSF